MIIDIRHKALKIVLLTVIAIIMASCQLPDDKIKDYSKLEGTITGFSRPTYMKCVGNHLFIMDDKGLYRLNLAQVDFSGDNVSSSDLYYKNNSIGSYGWIKHFDVSGTKLFLITYNSDTTTHYVLNIDMSAADIESGLQSWKVPNGRSANYVTVCEDSLVILGTANLTLKGFGSGAFDTTTDYKFAYDKSAEDDNITITSMKPIAVKNGNKYEIFIISGDTNQMGIRKYLYDKDDLSSDNIFLKSTHNTTLYPMDIQFRNPNNSSTIISSETSGVVRYSVTKNNDDTISMTKKSTISLGEDNGALKTLQYGSSSKKLACLYGYQVKPNEYDEHTYDIMAYWYGIMIISKPFSSSPTIDKTYIMEGWGTDFAIYDDKYLLAANQVKNRINIIKLD